MIAPYGDLESFTANDYIWSEADVEGGHPKYTLITDKNIAHGGNNCLLISDRTSKYNAAAFTLTEVIKSQEAANTISPPGCVPRTPAT